jgi:hypothetical protein
MGYAEQARLSEQHRAAQVRLQGIVAADTARVFPLLDVNNLDRTFQSYFSGMEATINSRRTISSSLSASYFDSMRSDSNVGGIFNARLSGGVNKDQLFTSLLVAGPISVKKNLAAGATVESARQAALVNTIKTSQRHVLNGGRATILDAVNRDSRSVGWARLTDGQPCAFCALLASRGPAYKSEGTSKFRAHDGCGCTAVPVFDVNAPWPGNSERYREFYDQNIRGKFVGGDGNNEAVRAWRKIYDQNLGGGATASRAVADAAQQIVAPTAGWRGAFDAARARIADPRQIGRVNAAGLNAADAAQLAFVNSRIDFLDDWADRWNRNKTDASRAPLRDEYARVVGSQLPRDVTGVYRSDVAAAKTVKRQLEEKQRGVADRVNGLPGAKLNDELDAVIDAGAALSSELDRRIGVRIADELTAGTGIAEATAARVALEKEIASLRTKRDKIFDDATAVATRKIDNGESIWTVTPDNRASLILRETQSILRKNRSYTLTTNKIKRLERDRDLSARSEKQLSEGSLTPGTQRYETIAREETIKLLDEVNPMGGVRLGYKSDSGKAITSGEAKKAMEFAEDSYPTAWLELVRDKFPQINLGTSARGYNAGGSKIRLSRSASRNIDGDTGYHAVAVHELGHSMEELVPGLKELQWAYHARRGAVPGPDGTPILPRPERMGSGYRGDEVTIVDRWREKYTGKVYGGGGPDSNWEVFTTGVESLLAGSRYFRARGDLGDDVEFRNWMLGVLSVLR